MITRLKETWVRHDDYTSRSWQVFWKSLVIVMLIMIPVDTFTAIQYFIAGNVISGIINLVLAMWFVFLLFIYK